MAGFSWFPAPSSEPQVQIAPRPAVTVVQSYLGTSIGAFVSHHFLSEVSGRLVGISPVLVRW